MRPDFVSNRPSGPKKDPKKQVLAIWEKISVKGDKYLFIKIAGNPDVIVTAFKNESKTGNQPDYIAYHREDS